MSAVRLALNRLLAPRCGVLKIAHDLTLWAACRKQRLGEA